jgi:hypothetical protein
MGLLIIAGAQIVGLLAALVGTLLLTLAQRPAEARDDRAGPPTALHGVIDKHGRVLPFVVALTTRGQWTCGLWLLVGGLGLQLFGLVLQWWCELL